MRRGDRTIRGHDAPAWARRVRTPSLTLRRQRRATGSLLLRRLYQLVVMPCRVHIPRWVVVCVEVPMEARRVVHLPQVGVLGDEAAHFWVVEACLGEEEVGFFVPEVSGEGEAVL